MRLFCPDICFAARRLCQFSSRRLLLVLVGRSLERLKPWRWLSCFKRVSGDSLTKQACGPEAQRNTNKEPTALTNRLSCFGIPSIVTSLFKARCYPSIPHFECLSLQLFAVFVLISFLDNRLERKQESEIVALDLTSVIRFYFPQQGMTRTEIPVRSAGREGQICCWFCLKFSPVGSQQLLQSQIFTSDHFEGNKMPHLGDLDEAKSSLQLTQRTTTANC